MLREESQALCERDRVRGNRFDGFNPRARTTYQTVPDRDDDLADDFELAFKEKIVRAVNGACETVFDRREHTVGSAFFDSCEKRLECRAGDKLTALAQKLDGSRLAESA